ncbi:hypothetical protein FGB62_25g033 [Gracilaria domingensis]|nr:hypothetical protein FGB62_25g033 [Gracilaria domingensis]
MQVVTTLLLAAVFGLLSLATSDDIGTFGPCRPDSGCAGERTCRKLEFDFDLSTLLGDIDFEQLEESVGGSCDDPDDYCVCFPPRNSVDTCRDDDECLESEECNSSFNMCISKAQAEALEDFAEGDGLEVFCMNDCPDGRQCVNVFSVDDLSTGVCLAKFTPSSSSSDNTANEGTDNDDANADEAESDADDASDDDEDDSSEVCIAAKSLAHMKQNDLIYPNHVPARVLCDSFESCATPGHMVRYHGKAMMMKSYCNLVGGCTRTVMHVNSPRYRRALELPSDTPHLSFTAFAARYTSKLEEHVLRTAVHMGL